MTSSSELRPPTSDIRRIGCVPYLNSQPLIFGIEDQVSLAVPSKLSRRLRSGGLDCALVPVVEYLEHPHYQILPSICIASRGVVRSVYLAYRGPLSGLEKAYLDPDSRTSSLLLQVVLREFFGLEVPFVDPRSEVPRADDARLWIGDPALIQRQSYQKSGWNLLDLGETWSDTTGLPFVYAFWLVRESLNAMPFLETLGRARDRGLEHLEEIIRRASRLPEPMVRSYLTTAVHYDLGGRELKGILEFQSLLKKLGLVDRESTLTLAA